MDLYHSTDTDGISEVKPDPNRMREILSQLDEPGVEDADHPDVSLVHDPSGWCISVYPSGIVTFENLDQDDGRPRYMTEVSRKQALELWLELSSGDIEKLNKRPWLREEA